MAKIHADPAQIEQMILYLATVVGMARPKAESLELHTAAMNNYVRLVVCIPPVELAGQEGGRGDRAGVNAQEETVPLELSLAHAIAAEYDGLLTAVDGVFGEGFQILLPAWHEPQTVPAHEETPCTLLLIESRDSVRMQLHNFFESAGFNLLEASDRDEALALLEIHSVGEGGQDQHSKGEATPLEANPAEGLVPLAEGVHVDLVLGDRASTQGIDQVPVILLDQPQVQAMTQKDLLAYVRSRLAQRFTFSASA